MPIDPWWRMLLVLSILIALIWAWQRRQHRLSGPVAAHLQRLRPEGTRPRTQDACPICCHHAAPTDTWSSRPPVPPWSAVKSRRGAMGRVVTQPFACPNRQCAVLSDY